MPTTRDEIPVASIILNAHNYRHQPVESQEEALASLLAGESDRAEMLALATDIAARGLDPSSLMIVEPVDGYWRVLEGNRRVAALKLMSNPDLVLDLPIADERTRKAYRDKLATVGGVATLPKDVLCVVTDDEELANHLIHLKHTGLGTHKGAGTTLWDTEGRHRFEQATAGADGGTSSNKQTANAVNLLDALRVHFAGDEEFAPLIEGARQGGLTTLGRVLLRPENQLRLGVQIEGQAVRIVVSRDALRTAMQRVLTDLGTPRLNSRTTNKATDVVDYLDNIAQDLPTTKDRLTEPVPATPPEGGASTTPPPKPKRTKQPPVMARPFPGLTLRHASPKTKALLAEMKKLRIEDSPYLCAIANRVLVDLYTVDVLAALGMPADDNTVRRGKKCLELLDPPGTKARQRRFPRIADAYNTNTGDLSIDSMHFYVHRANYHPTPNVIRIQVQDYEPFLQALDDYVEDQKTAGGTP